MGKLLADVGRAFGDFFRGIHEIMEASYHPPTPPVPPGPAVYMPLSPAELLVDMIVVLFDADDETMRLSPAGFVVNEKLRVCITHGDDELCLVRAFPEAGTEGQATLEVLPMIELPEGADNRITEAFQGWLVRRALAASKRGVQ